MTMAFPDHFSAVAEKYAAYRPHYPPALAEALAALTSPGVAWDIGCGNGQLSVALAARFDRVIATDPAHAQLDHAERHPRVEYRCEPAEASSLPGAGSTSRSPRRLRTGSTGRGSSPRSAGSSARTA